VESLRWFGGYKKSSWKVGWDYRREAYASGRGGRYQIQRYDEGFVVRYCPPYKCPDQPWQDIGTAATQEEAIAQAQAHNDSGPCITAIEPPGGTDKRFVSLGSATAEGLRLQRKIPRL
jgi:hypothetical protein